MTESLHMIHAELEGSSATRFSGHVPNGSSSAGHSRAPSSSTSPTHSRTHSQVFNNGHPPALLRRWDQCSTSSPSDDSDGAPTRDESAIYTSPSRKRKGKERATFDDGDEVGMSSSIQLHDTDVHERRHFSTRSGGQGHYYDERLEDTDDNSFVNTNGTTPHAMPKSCLKPTPTPSSSNLAGSSTTPSPTQSPKAKPNIGVRFVRFTLGLGGGSSKKSKEREREPKLICTTPGEACAGETETETDEPSLRRLPTARRPPPATPTGKSRLFGFAGWRRGQAPPPPPATLPPGHHHPRQTGPSPLSLSSISNNTLSITTLQHSPPPLQARSNPNPNPNPSSICSKFTLFLFQAFRLLSIVPALCGIIFCIWMIVSMGALGSPSEQDRAREYVQKYWRCFSKPPYATDTSGLAGSGLAGAYGEMQFLLCDDGRGVLRGPPVPGRVDWIVAAAWAFLTAHHCLGLSTGLLARWKVYYTPSSTLVRLLALQGICWPATQLTLTVVGGGRRPAAAWAVIGTCTAVSRSVQIWVTSNIVREEDDEPEAENATNGNANPNATPDGGDEDSSKSAGNGSGSGSRAVMRFLHAFAAVIGGGSPGDESGDDEADPTASAGGGDTGTATAKEYDTSTFEFSEVEPDSPITPSAGLFVIKHKAGHMML
ncbi:hypothetical protein EST38_g6826 [Candolleomyces aberdarensis]|uniref:Uncharacterized protein n=1 Tax=Candolleomyces aberdarensis TaxID=2316362 RepID=A0A4Q2DIM2_9AGAR|nr:hypothetical protein EST38_g6826 [Candolleomyces aberdarensis]